MKKIFVFIVIFALTSGGAFTFAQMNQEDFIKVAVDSMEINRKVLVAANNDLSDEESQAFWPIYDSYRSNVKKVNERLYRLIDKYAENYASLSDEVASEILGEAIAIDVERGEYLRGYVDSLKEILPVRKVAKLYQIENKMDSLARAELALQIPFVSAPEAEEETVIAIN